MDPDVQALKAKRRIAPTLIAKSGSPDDSPGFRPSQSDAYSIFVPQEDAVAEIEIDPAVIEGKKRTRPSSDLVHPEMPKKSRQLGGTASSSPLALEPFYFLVVNSPRYWACAYESLSVWMQKAINHDIVVSEMPFSLSESESLVCLASSSPCRGDWMTLIAALGEPERIHELWVKFTVIDKILTLFGEEEWHGKNSTFFSLQHHLWWISHVQPWFSITHIRSSQDYMQLAMSALVLELWWRMVWARHTQRLFLEKAPASSTENTSNFPSSADGFMAQENNGFNHSRLDSEDTDEVLDQSELGEGTDSESEIGAADSDFEVDLPEDTILHSGGMGKLDGFFAEHYKANGKSSKSAQWNAGDDEESNDQSSESADSSSSSGGFPRYFIGGIVDEAAYDYGNPAMNVDSTTDWLGEIPPATALFFAHPRIGDALDKIERQYWISERWDCTLAFEVLLKMATERNSDLQLPEVSQTILLSQMEYAYNRVFVPFLQNVGVEVSAVERGNEENEAVFGALPLTWAFNSTFGNYWVDTVLRCAFGHLTTGGLVPAVHFLGLFPQLLLNADSKMDAQVSRITEDLHAKLVAKGTITPELEALVKTLDSLTAEKNALLRQDKKQCQAIRLKKQMDGTSKGAQNPNQTEDMEDTDAIVEIDPNTLEGRLHAHRLQRIKQIDVMIEEIRLDFNRLTGSIDHVQTKRKRRTKTDLTMDMSNFVTTPLADAQNQDNAELPSDEAIWGLPSLNPS